MKRWLVLLIFSALAWGQGSVSTGSPIAIDQRGRILQNALVAICTNYPGLTPSPPCGEGGNSLVTIYTDISLSHACSGPAGSPLNNVGAPTVGAGCSNPGTPINANVEAYAPSGVYWCEFYGSGLVTKVQACMFPASPVSLSSPGPIGNVTPGTGAFTSLTLGASTCQGTTPINGYWNCSSGITTGSSLEVNGGSILETQDDAYYQWSTNGGKLFKIQAGPRSVAANGNNTFTLPDLLEGSPGTASGEILGVTGATDASAPGNCLFYGASQGLMKDSGFGCNANVAFPNTTNGIIWTNGSFTGKLMGSAFSANRTFTLPNISGTVGLTLNSTNGRYMAKAGVAGCTTGGTAGNSCGVAITVTWPGSFEDTNYSAGCEPSGAATNFPSSPFIGTKSAGSMTVNYIAITNAAASWATIDCWAIHN